MKQKVPFGELINGRRSFLGFNLLRLTIMLVSVGLLLVGAVFINQPGPRKNFRQQEAQKLVVKIKTLEKQISDQQGDLMKLLLTFKDKTGRDISYLQLMNLTNQEKILLTRRVRSERGVTVKSLLQTILEKSAEIKSLKQTIALIEAKLPAAVVVQKGQNHHDIALTFLENQCGLTHDEAIKWINQTPLYENLVPGFKVWNFYNKGVYGTFVTQGQATVSPGWLQKRAREKSLAEREHLASERNILSGEVAELRQTNRGLNSRISDLSSHYKMLSGKFSTLTCRYQDLDRQWNSLFYTLDLRRHLVRKGIIKGGFLKRTVLKEFLPSHSQRAIDLRRSQQIRMSAAGLKAKKIKRVVLYPRHFKKGIDYRVTIPEEGDKAVVTILKADKLKNEHVVISVD
jgi:hypothetical protein